MAGAQRQLLLLPLHVVDQLLTPSDDDEAVEVEEGQTRAVDSGLEAGALQNRLQPLAREVAASRQRYVVSDLLRMTWNKKAVYEPWSWRAGTWSIACPRESSAGMAR